MSSLPVTALCVPDLYLTEERVNMLFDDFRKSVPESQQNGVIFASLVNSVRQLYLSQILHLQQVLISTPTSELAMRCDEQLAALHDRLATKHKMQVDDMADIHSRQLRHIRAELEQERAVLSKHTPTEWIVGIDVVYGDQASQKPANRIKEFSGHQDSIAYCHTGKYVWLVPRLSKGPTCALTGIDIAIQEDHDSHKRSLSLGGGGKNRYLVPLNVAEGSKIYSINLLRLGHAMPGTPDGYDGSSSDINNGRNGGWLYLIWKSQSIQS